MAGNSNREENQPVENPGFLLGLKIIEQLNQQLPAELRVLIDKTSLSPQAPKKKAELNSL